MGKHDSPDREVFIERLISLAYQKMPEQVSFYEMVMCIKSLHNELKTLSILVEQQNCTIQAFRIMMDATNDRIQNRPTVSDSLKAFEYWNKGELK